MPFLQHLLYGIAIGLALGLTGGGGSIITLPILVYAVGEAVHPAIGTSLAIVGGVAMIGALGQRSLVRWRTGITLGALGLVGAVPGSILSHLLPGNVLLLLFSATMIVAAAAMLRGRRGGEEDGQSASPVVVIAAGLGLGFLTGFLGVGGGFLIVPTLVFALGLRMRTAIATSLFVIALNSFSSFVAHAFGSHLDWTLIALFVIGGVTGSLAGASVGKRLQQQQLKRIFAMFVLFVGLFTGASASGLLPFHVRSFNER